MRYFVLVLVLAACGSPNSTLADDDAAVAPDADPDAPDADPAAPDAMRKGGGGGVDAGMAELDCLRSVWTLDIVARQAACEGTSNGAEIEALPDANHPFHGALYVDGRCTLSGTNQYTDSLGRTHVLKLYVVGEGDLTAAGFGYSFRSGGGGTTGCSAGLDVTGTWQPGASL